MYKIKLLTLLLVSLINVSCIENKTSYPNIKYSLAYIGGEFEGLILKNYLMNYLSSYNLYDKKSVSQFYIFADGSKYLSNNTAVEKIKKENTEVLVKSFINNLGKVVNKCEKAEILRMNLLSIRNE